MLEQIVSWPRGIKRPILIAADFVLLPLALSIAIALRMGNWHAPSAYNWWVFFLPPVIAVPIFIRFGLYRAVTRFMGDKATFTILLGVTISALLFSGVYAFLDQPNIPRGAMAIYWVLAVFNIGASRIGARIALRHLDATKSGQRRVLIYGAGSAGRQLAAALRISQEYAPVAFVDDDEMLRGVTIDGIAVYRASELESLVERFEVKDVLLAIPSASRNRRIEIINQLIPLHLRVQVVPGLPKLVGGDVTISDVREVEIDELLGRDAVPPDATLLAANIRDKAVIVTGAEVPSAANYVARSCSMAPKSW